MTVANTDRGLCACECGDNSASKLSHIKVSPNGRHFVDGEGKPLFYLADTAWTLSTRANPDEVIYYMDDRKAKGFNVIHMIILPWGEKKDYLGNEALIGGDFGQPNDKYFEYVDFVMDQAETRGMRMAIWPLWDGGGPQTATPELRGKLRTFCAYLGKRYGQRPILWFLGGDKNPDAATEDATRIMAAGLVAGAGHELLVSYHPGGGGNSAKWFHHDSWLDFNALQSGHNINSKNYDMISYAYAQQPIKPVIEAEAGYEHLTNNLVEFKPGVRVLRDWDSRRFGYHAVFAGAAGYAYGCQEVYELWREGAGVPRWAPSPGIPWKEALQMPGATQMRWLRFLIESRPMLSRVPCKELLAGNVGEADTLVLACRDEAGSYAMIYSSCGNPFTVKTGKLSGAKVKASWYCPRTGKVTAAGEFAPGADKEFVPPTKGEDQDWVLVLDDAGKGYKAPGVV